MKKEDHDVEVKVTMHETVDGGIVRYFAASPPDYRSSFSGSGLPFANAEQAFQNTPNKGTVRLPAGSNTFVLRLLYPNAYYVNLGSVLVPSVVHFRYTSGGQPRARAHVISTGVPYRMLTYPAQHTRSRHDAGFYDNRDLPIRTQEQILRSYAFPAANAMAPNFWGLKPPV